MKLKFVVAVLATFIASSTTFAQNNPTLSDLTAGGASQLSKDQLQALLPGAKVASIASTGSTRYWENSLDGKFIVSSDNRAGKSGRPTQGSGAWHIGDNGTYCVQLEWSTSTEQWCRFLFKAGDKYYGVKSLGNQAEKALEYSFSR